MQFPHEQHFADSISISQTTEEVTIADDWNFPQPEPYTPYAFLITPDGNQTELPNIPQSREQAIQTLAWLGQSKQLSPGIFQCWLSSREYPNDWASAFDLLLTDQKQIALISERCFESHEAQGRILDTDIRIATEFSVRQLPNTKCKVKVTPGDQPQSAKIVVKNDSASLSIELFLRSWTDVALLIHTADDLPRLIWLKTKSKLAAFADGIANAVEDHPRHRDALSKSIRFQIVEAVAASPT